MRQAGIIAAAGLYALENNVARLAEDHENAKSLARGLNELDELDVQYSESQTNMVFVNLSGIDSGELTEFLAERAIVINCNDTVRLVPHLDISESDIRGVVAAFKAYLSR